MTNYPDYLVLTYQLPEGVTITLRPIRAEDIDLVQEFVRHLSSQTKHSHYRENFRELSKDVLNRLTHIDYEHAMVLIATCVENDKEVMIGMGQYVATPNLEECDVLILIADEWHHKGIATHLITRLIEVAKEKSIKKMIATIPAINAADLAFAKSLGFEISNSDDPTLKKVSKLL